MSIPKRGVKIMDNNIKLKTGMAPPHSRLKASGQELNPYPEVIKKKVKKKKKKGYINSKIPVLQLSSPIFFKEVMSHYYQ